MPCALVEDLRAYRERADISAEEMAGMIITRSKLNSEYLSPEDTRSGKKTKRVAKKTKKQGKPSSHSEKARRSTIESKQEGRTAPGIATPGEPPPQGQAG